MSHKYVSFRIRRSKSTGQFWFAVLAGNNRTLCSSEQYKRIGGVHNAIKSLIIGLQLNEARIIGLSGKATILPRNYFASVYIKQASI